MFIGGLLASMGNVIAQDEPGRQGTVPQLREDDYVALRPLLSGPGKGRRRSRALDASTPYCFTRLVGT
jgi:hypothetical protein